MEHTYSVCVKTENKKVSLRLIIIRGLPGSGKTGKAKSLVEEGIVDAHYESDMYFRTHDGSYNYNKEHLGYAHDWCRHSVRKALAAGKNVVVSNTFVKLWEFKEYLELGKEFGAEIAVVKCSGQTKKNHEVPESTVERMRRS